MITVVFYLWSGLNCLLAAQLVFNLFNGGSQWLSISAFLCAWVAATSLHIARINRRFDAALASAEISLEVLHQIGASEERFRFYADQVDAALEEMNRAVSNQAWKLTL